MDGRDIEERMDTVAKPWNANARRRVHIERQQLQREAYIAAFQPRTSWPMLLDASRFILAGKFVRTTARMG